MADVCGVNINGRVERKLWERREHMSKPGPLYQSLVSPWQ